MAQHTQSLHEVVRDLCDSLRPRSFGRPTTSERLAAAFDEWKVRFVDWRVYRAPSLDRSIPLSAALVGASLLMITTATVTWFAATNSQAPPTSVERALIEGVNAKAHERSTGTAAPIPLRAVRRAH